MVYNLIKARLKLAKHTKEFLRAFPNGRPLHEIPLSEISERFAGVLNGHSDFERKPSETRIVTFYPRYYHRSELGHIVFKERLVSALKSQNLLSGKTEELFRKFLGDLHFSPPEKVRASQLRALNSLVKHLGEKRVSILLEKADSFSDEQIAEYRQNDQGIQAVFADSLGNGIVQNVFYWFEAFKRENGSPVEKIRRSLKMRHPASSVYS